ncbi:hypothetical protein BOTBODRAFT_28817 [Botryobasidium botryosum FD-172 SS1]|uniref:Uncharacterized protein n=1 Tax=Botryobasidium botryosum (strain FD-172 SS1) TaxID=930990 RepID=A0A067MUP7_BOTB1|nr:hypothetical protein BOTBODRAFT_28817 [Botryobasidium botryosum FD-172 SS1]
MILRLCKRAQLTTWLSSVEQGFGLLLLKVWSFLASGPLHLFLTTLRRGYACCSLLDVQRSALPCIHHVWKSLGSFGSD